MRAVARVAVLALATGLPGVPLAAQAGWGPPRPPCELIPANSKVEKGIQALRGAAEKPDQRDPQLAQAKKNLGEAIVQDNQGANPAAWYYLGRYYVAVGDVAGADTALARAATLAPKCAADVATYRDEMFTKLLNDGLTAWQDGKQDSALGLLHVAARLEPHNPKTFATVAALYASGANDDSAFAYYRLAARTAGDDAAFAHDRQEALQRLAPGRSQSAGPSGGAAGCSCAREPRFHPARRHERFHSGGAPCGLVPIAEGSGGDACTGGPKTVHPRFDGAGAGGRPPAGGAGRGSTAARGGLERAHRRLRPGDRRAEGPPRGLSG